MASTVTWSGSPAPTPMASTVLRRHRQHRRHRVGVQHRVGLPLDPSPAARTASRRAATAAAVR